MKIAICHDYIDTIGGGETEMKMLAEGLARNHDVHFYTPYFNRSLPFKIEVPLTVFTSLKFFNVNGLRQIELAWKFSRLNLEEYDALITENYWSVFANHKNHIHHCEAPIRQFYDLRGLFSMRLPSWHGRFIYNSWVDFMIHFEQKAVKKVKTIIANSEFTKTRIKLYYNRDDAIVIYPPVVTKNYKYKKTGNYFLYLGRFDTNKRIEFMIEAFKKSGKRLIAIGGGPLLEKAKKLAAGYKNITLLGYQPDEVVREYMANCMSMVYLPIFEDFGQVPVEGMAAGKPCLGIREGGLMETIVDGKTGWLLLPRMEDVVEKIKSITPEECSAMRRNCEVRAKKFDIEPYLEQFNQVVRETVEG